MSVARRSAFSSRRPVPHGRARSSDMLFARRIACRTARPLLRCYCSSAKSNDIVLAVMNVGKQHAPLDDPMMAEFSAATPAVNALARATPGFVWSYDEPHDGSMRLTVPELVADDLLMPQLLFGRTLTRCDILHSRAATQCTISGGRSGSRTFHRRIPSCGGGALPICRQWRRPLSGCAGCEITGRVSTRSPSRAQSNTRGRLYYLRL